ncbi:DUF2264 domain-containing protein [Clostridium lacusfryxellense]|uniref:DUF2264 domain-containing protein n=1 Tax=Clostridium lacusfryxellense TaxID=205328 RepID=UPI001C0BC3EE|nr:DUF2264 domain-containing protein [Clostridium lacusfryxellense]MBU3113278.1 DUF2264 domain-containing protein [Clostridium lacusfryxellense]
MAFSLNSFGLIPSNFLNTLLIVSLIEPVKGRYSSSCARLNLGKTGAYYSGRIATFEAFSRILWGLVPLTAGGYESGSISTRGRAYTLYNGWYGSNRYI